MLGSSSGELDFYFARILTFTFSLSIECSHMMQALEQSLFIPHKSFIFLLGVFAFERMLLNFHGLDVFVKACEGRIPTVAENVSSVCRKWWDT